MAAYASSLRGEGPVVHTLVLWLQQYLPSIAAHFLQAPSLPSPPVALTVRARTPRNGLGRCAPSRRVEVGRSLGVAVQMDAEEEEEEEQRDGGMEKHEEEAPFVPEVGHLGRTYQRMGDTDQRAATEATEEERRRHRIELLRALLDGTAAPPPAVAVRTHPPNIRARTPPCCVLQ
jgi:hypothetical protein